MNLRHSTPTPRYSPVGLVLTGPTEIDIGSFRDAWHASVSRVLPEQVDKRIPVKVCRTGSHTAQVAQAEEVATHQGCV